MRIRYPVARMLFSLCSAGAVLGLPDGLARTPPRGFATWNVWPFARHQRVHAVNESQCHHWAQAIADSGLAAAGYNFFLVQEPCFGGRDNATGELLESGDFARRWPKGMAAFGRFLNERGMRLGIYTSATLSTCGGCVGTGAEYAKQDLATFARWGVDMVEIDDCGAPPTEATYAVFREAVASSGRPMVISVGAEGLGRNIPEWGPRVGHMWRVSGDIENSFEMVVRNYDSATSKYPRMADAAGSGSWNDFDMMEVGGIKRNFSWGGPGLTLSEARAHVTLWAMLKSPMLLGGDVSAMSREVVDMLANKDMLQIHEDPLGAQAVRLDENFPGMVHEKATPLSLVPCNSTDPQQRWLTGYYYTPPVMNSGAEGAPLIRSAATVGFCVSSRGCMPQRGEADRKSVV